MTGPRTARFDPGPRQTAVAVLSRSWLRAPRHRSPACRGRLQALTRGIGPAGRGSLGSSPEMSHKADAPWREHRRAPTRSTGVWFGGLALRTTRTAGSRCGRCLPPSCSPQRRVMRRTPRREDRCVCNEWARSPRAPRGSPRRVRARMAHPCSDCDLPAQIQAERPAHPRPCSRSARTRRIAVSTARPTRASSSGSLKTQVRPADPS